MSHIERVEHVLERSIHTRRLTAGHAIAELAFDSGEPEIRRELELPLLRHRRALAHGDCKDAKNARGLHGFAGVTAIASASV